MQTAGVSPYKLLLGLSSIIWIGALAALVFDFSFVGLFSKVGKSTNKPIANLSIVAGDVRFQPLSVPTWNSAIRGTELAAGDSVFTGNASKATVAFFDQGSSIELAPESMVVIRKLAGDFEVELKRGYFIANFEGKNSRLAVRSAGKVPSIINAGITGGRIAVDSDQDSAFTILSGSAEITAGSKTSQVESGGSLLMSTLSPLSNEAPLLSSPAPGATIASVTGESVILKWNVIKKASATAKVEYIVEVATDISFNKPVFSLKTAEAFVSLPSLATGLYYWRVGTAGSSNGKTAFSIPRELNVFSDRAPRLFQPADGAVFSAASQRSYLVKSGNSATADNDADKNSANQQRSAAFFDWEELANATGHQLEIASDKEFTKIVRKVETIFASATVVGLRDGSYFWRATSNLDGDRKSPASQIFKFKLVSIKEAPVVTAGQQTTGLLSASSSAPIAPLRPLATAGQEWHDSKIPQTYPKSGDLKSAKLPAVAPSPVAKPVPKAVKPAAILPSPKPTPVLVPDPVPPPLLDAPDIDEDQLIEYKPKKEGAWRLPSLRYLLGALSLVGTAYAADEKVDGKEGAVNSTPEVIDAAILKWKEVTGAVGYYLEIASDKDFVKIVNSATTTVANFPWVNPPEGRFYFRVAAVDKLGRKGKSSRVSRLTIRKDDVKEAPKAIVTGADELEPPSVITPKAGEIVEVPEDGKVSFKWNRQPEAKGYEIEVSSTEVFTKPAFVKDTLKQTESTKLKFGKWFWRIRCLVQDDGKGAWSDPIAFEVKKPQVIFKDPSLRFVQFGVTPRSINSYSRFVDEELKANGSQLLGAELDARYTYAGFGATAAVKGQKYVASGVVSNVMSASFMFTYVKYFALFGGNYGAAASIGYKQSPIILLRSRNLAEPKVDKFSAHMAALSVSIYQDLWQMGELELFGQYGKPVQVKGMELRTYSDAEGGARVRFLIGKQYFWGFGGAYHLIRAEGSAEIGTDLKREFVFQEKAYEGWIGGGRFFN